MGPSKKARVKRSDEAVIDANHDTPGQTEAKRHCITHEAWFSVDYTCAEECGCTSRADPNRQDFLFRRDRVDT